MKQKILSILIVLSSLFPSVFAQGFGEAIEINQNWKFILQDVENGEQIDLNDMHWQKVDLPHYWSVKEQLSPSLASCTGYLPGGIGWYRKQLFVPDVRRGEKVYLYFEGVYNRSEVFVNGELLGKRPNGYISFMYDITAKINYGENNLIAVRVNHSQSADSRWYTGSGIYRDVWLVYANLVHIAQWGVYAWPEKLESGYKLNIEVDIENEKGDSSVLIIDNELFSPGNKLVSKTSGKIRIDSYETATLKASLELDYPDLWSLDTPSLYMLKTSVYYNGKLVDKAHTQTGFRSLTFNPDKGFALNGEWMKVKGVCLHHDAGVLGSAVPREVWKRRLLTLKEIGVNAIRTSHNPQATDLYDLCDELGFLVMNEAYDEWEFPKRKWLEGWNLGTPGFQGSYDFFGSLKATDGNYYSGWVSKQFGGQSQENQADVWLGVNLGSEKTVGGLTVIADRDDIFPIHDQFRVFIRMGENVKEISFTLSPDMKIRNTFHVEFEKPVAADGVMIFFDKDKLPVKGGKEDQKGYVRINEWLILDENGASVLRSDLLPIE